MPEMIEQPEQATKPWKGVCCSRCYMAKTDKTKCKCRCKGEHHGKGHIKRLTDMEGEKNEKDNIELKRGPH